jgi:hypothetical protein
MNTENVAPIIRVLSIGMMESSRKAPNELLGQSIGTTKTAHFEKNGGGIHDDE